MVNSATSTEMCKEGATGVDGMTIDETAQWLRSHPGELRRNLLNGSYQPQDVRGKSILKPNGGGRKLGIPTVIDRIVQQAIVQVLTPILDPQMRKSSYGFRPKRSAHDALRCASTYAREGHRMVVDPDLEKRGHKFCRYADDCIIMVRTIAAARRVLASVTRYLEGILKLKVNREKSKIVSAGECPYLGYIIGAAGALRVAKEKVVRFKERIREMPRRNRGRRLGATIEELNAYIRGWGNDYKLAAIQKKAKELDKWIRRKLRVIKLKQCKRVYTIACFLRDEGVREDHDFMVAGTGKGWWRLSKTRVTHRAMGKEWFRNLVLVSLQSVVCKG